MRLIDGIKAVETGNMRGVGEPLHYIKLTSTPSMEYYPQFAREYSITVTLGANQWIAEDVVKASGGEVINEAIRHMKYAIVEHVYGELRRDLLDLQMDIRNEVNYYDSPSLKKLVRIIEKISL